jgi:hypothetical protein
MFEREIRRFAIWLKDFLRRCLRGVRNTLDHNEDPRRQFRLPAVPASTSFPAARMSLWLSMIILRTIGLSSHYCQCSVKRRDLPGLCNSEDINSGDVTISYDDEPSCRIIRGDALYPSDSI